MSWTDKELSDLARKAEADHAFAYQDSFWGEMENMLPAKKKPLWPIFLGIALPIVGISAFFLTSSKTSLETSNAAKTASFDRQEIINLNKLNSRNETINIETNISTSSTKTAMSSMTEENNLKSASVQSNRVKSNSIKKDGITLKQSRKEVVIREKAPVSILTEVVLIENKATEKFNITAEETVENEKSNSLMNVNISTENTESEVAKDINRLKFAQLSTFDLQQNSQPTMLKYRSKRRFFSAYGELGFTLGEAYLNNQVGHVQSFAIGAGGRLTKNKFFVQTGLGFDIEKAGVELSETTREYGYGVKTFENRMNYREMYRAFVPLTFGYLINKHTLQFGATASYLMSARMKYAYLENDALKRNETIYGETKGWNSFGLKVNVGYGFSIFPSTTLGANFQVQLMNQLNNNWAQDENKLPISGQVFIRKTIR